MYIFVFIFMIALGITFWGRGRYVKIYGEETENRLLANLSGSELAEKILNSRGIEGVTVAKSRSLLEDFYSPEKKEISLAPCHFDGTNFPALAVAAQQAGKAIQDFEGHRPLMWRTSVIRWTVYLSIPLAIVALVTTLMGMTKTILPMVLLIWSAIAFWNVATIPTELDAGERAKKQLKKLKVFRNLDERVGVERVMGAASTAYLDGFFTVASWVGNILMPWARKRMNPDP